MEPKKTFKLEGARPLPEKAIEALDSVLASRRGFLKTAGVMMVGDSSVDVMTARNAGIFCCCVTYGFQPESLADPPPDMLVDRMQQLADWVLKQ